ncbi:MAG: J domain-containing protein [Candidatus Thorarchaeota archaeon]
MVDAYPLQWPTGWVRAKFQRRSNFQDHSMAYATHFMMEELRKLGATSIVLSTNVQLKRDGLPYSGRKPPDDKGVAVYFQLFGGSQCMPCDKWNRVECNLWAIAKSIEALRGLERWGAKEMVEASFRGFKALPQVATQPKVDYFSGCTTQDELRSRYKNLAKTLHPDQGGDGKQFVEMLKQYDIRKHG